MALHDTYALAPQDSACFDALLQMEPIKFSHYVLTIPVLALCLLGHGLLYWQLADKVEIPTHSRTASQLSPGQHEDNHAKANLQGTCGLVNQIWRCFQDVPAAETSRGGHRQVVLTHMQPGSNRHAETNPVASAKPISKKITQVVCSIHEGSRAYFDLNSGHA